MSSNSVQDTLKRAGIQVPQRVLNRLKPHELSLTEKWAIEKVQPGTFPGAKMPPWLKAFT
jgi:hypothetical protein